MKQGILIYNQREDEWHAWIEHRCYLVEPGDFFELRIQHIYFKACLTKDISEWTISLNQAVEFTLNINEVYRIRLNPEYYITVSAEF